jgi:hypothetical protein
VDGDEDLKAELAKAIAECEYLREENTRLKLRLGEAPDHRPRPEHPPSRVKEKPQSSATVTVDSRPEVKVSLFKDLFRGRDDVYAVRWEGKNGKTGYSPAGDRQRDPPPFTGRWPKKSSRITKLYSLSAEVIRDHLLGKQTIGLSPANR